MGRSKYGYPEALRDVSVPVQEMINEKIDELNENAFWYQQEVRWGNNDLDSFLDKIQQISLGKLSDSWYRRFTGGSYWSGILSYDPWYQLTDRYEEEEIWCLLLEHHSKIKDGKLVFQYNEKSPIDKWLRKHTSDGDTPINVETVFRHAVKTMLNDYEFEFDSLLPDEEEEEENVDE